MRSQSVLYGKDEHIATITLNRPEVLNAFDEQMAAALDEVIHRASTDRDVWVVVVLATGKSFCTGVDVRLLAQSGSGNTNERMWDEPMARSGHIGWSAFNLFKLDKPTVAAVRGHAYGGGLGIALACDVRVAGDDADFCAVFTKRGLAPDAGTSFFLKQSLGYSKACELAFTARPIQAAEAELLGMVNRVVPVEQVDAEAMSLAREIVTGAPVAVRMAKRALRRGLEQEALASVEYELFVNSVCARTEDIVEGGRAFLERRPPHWKGR